MNQPQTPPLLSTGKFAPADAWQVLLGTNHPGESDYVARLEGRLPERLAGTLYRNGPGMFERAGSRKQHLLDGDGVIQAFDLRGGEVRYRSRFVPTPKFTREQAAGRFREPTWTTLAPRWLDNLPGFPRHSQAGITTYLHQGALIALDEVGPAFAFDADTLAPIGFRDLVPSRPPKTYKAHAKCDGRTGDWTFLGWHGYRNIDLEVIVRADDGTLKLRRKVRAPRNNYIHDFFDTEHHVVVNLHPVTLTQPLPMLLGLRSFTDSLAWQPKSGNLLVVIPKDPSQSVRTLEAPARFMWHAFNAYEDADGIVADFIGYDAPDHFIGERPLLKTLMRGENGVADAAGLVHRYRIPHTGSAVRDEILVDIPAEFPSVHPTLGGYPHRYGYATLAQHGNFIQDGVGVFDLQRGALEQEFRFGPGCYAGEPVFAPDPQASDDERGGWLLSLVLDGRAGRSFLAIFDARRIGDGPVARAHLRHHSPLSFHGCWKASP